MSVYKDKQRNTYYFVTRINGKQVKRRGFRTSKDAKRAEAECILNAPDWNDPLFEHVADEYLQWYKKRRKASSYETRERIIRMHIKPHFSNKKINSIGNRDITQFHDLIIDKHSINYLKAIHASLSAVFNFAIRQEYTTKNPARNVGNIEGTPTKHMDYWTLDEFKTFINAVDNDMYYALFMVLYYSGMRKGELRALTWNDIDLDNNTINIDKSNSSTTVTTTKTGAIRRIQMPRQIMRLLSLLKAERNPKSDYVVFGEFYSPIGKTTLDHNFKKYIDKSGVRKIRIHDLRHSHASYLINKGVTISVIAHRLGHAKVSTTLNTYSHLYPSTEKEAVLDMENDFKQAEVFEFKRG
ncbi:site-specific integrase [Virgibacillus siamensis]|uniref:site-specific integrase n=1 Tax=Virgibacillus siamensis TaxID=480071 RepID=UPI00098482AE|nr:site-specific integrase [Virgibacillus siamensis]